MAQSIPALVEPSVLRWARESIGLVPVAATRKIGVPDGRVTEWEAGTAAPTIAQLRKAADVYKRPLGVFFLPEPTVVTEETPSGRLNRPRIPDVCGALSVRCVNLVGFIKDQGWTF